MADTLLRGMKKKGTGTSNDNDTEQDRAVSPVDEMFKAKLLAPLAKRGLLQSPPAGNAAAVAGAGAGAGAGGAGNMLKPSDLTAEQERDLKRHEDVCLDFRMLLYVTSCYVMLLSYVIELCFSKPESESKSVRCFCLSVLVSIIRSFLSSSYFILYFIRSSNFVSRHAKAVRLLDYLQETLSKVTPLNPREAPK
jgi:hypothetical protein